MAGVPFGLNDQVVVDPAAPTAGPRPVFTLPDARGDAKERRDNATAQRDEGRFGIEQRGEVRTVDKQAFDKAAGLRADYSSNQLVKAYEASVPMFVAALKTTPDRVGDQLLITAFAKLSDPTTGVLGGEREGVASGSQSTVESIQTQLNSKLLDEGGVFTTETREQLRTQLLNLMAQRGNAYKQQRERYIADAQASGVDPARVVGPNVSDPERQFVIDYFKPKEAREPEMRGGVPAGSEVEFGMDAPMSGPEGAFDRNAWLKNMGLDPDEEAEIVAFWNANRGNKDFTVSAAKKWFVERGYDLPSDPDINAAVRDARKGATFTAMDSAAAKAAYEAKLDTEIARRREKTGDGAPGKMDLATQGVSGGLGDEAAGIGGLISNALGYETGYDFERDLRRRELEQARERSGGMGTAVELLGNAASMGVNAGAVPITAREAALAGAVPGFGYGEGAVDSVTGATLGGALGAVVGKGAEKVADWRAGRAGADAAAEAPAATPANDFAVSGRVDASPAPAQPTQSAALSGAEQTEIADLAKRATSWGPGARKARQTLARKAAANPEARAAAERLGIEVPPDILSDNAQVQSLTGLSRSQVGSDAETAWRADAARISQQADQALADLGGSTDLAQLSDDVLTRLNGTADSLQRKAGALRDEVDAAIPPSARVDASNLKATVAKLIEDYGGLAQAKAAMTPQEKALLTMLGEGEEAIQPTYARLARLRKDIGQALEKNSGPWADVNRHDLGVYYKALADDQIAAVEAIGGKEIADKQRTANTLFAQMYDQRGQMQDLFGKNLEKGLAPLLRRALTAGAKGDAKDITTLLDRIPEDARGGAMVSAVMSLSRSNAAHGGFSFANFTKLYRGLRENSPVYAKIAKAIGPEGSRVLNDLYVISNRMAAAETGVLKTGKANQGLAAAMQAESLVSNVMKAASGRAASAAGAAIGGATAGPAGAAAGAGLVNSAKQSLSGAGASRLDKVHNLFASPEFKSLLDRVAAGEDVAKAGQILWNAKAFHNLARSVGALRPAERKAWLSNIISAGSSEASNVINFPGAIASGPARMAAGERPPSDDEGSAKKAGAGQ